MPFILRLLVCFVVLLSIPCSLTAQIEIEQLSYLQGVGNADAPTIEMIKDGDRLLLINETSTRDGEDGLVMAVDIESGTTSVLSFNVEFSSHLDQSAYYRSANRFLRSGNQLFVLLHTAGSAFSLFRIVDEELIHLADLHGSILGQMTSYEGENYFVLNPPAHPNSWTVPIQLWKTDGTNIGTRFVRDLYSSEFGYPVLKLPIKDSIVILNLPYEFQGKIYAFNIYTDESVRVFPGNGEVIYTLGNYNGIIDFEVFDENIYFPGSVSGDPESESGIFRLIPEDLSTSLIFSDVLYEGERIRKLDLWSKENLLFLQMYWHEAQLYKLYVANQSAPTEFNLLLEQEEVSDLGQLQYEQGSVFLSLKMAADEASTLLMEVDPGSREILIEYALNGSYYQILNIDEETIYASRGHSSSDRALYGMNRGAVDIDTLIDLIPAIASFTLPKEIVPYADRYLFFGSAADIEDETSLELLSWSLENAMLEEVVDLGERETFGAEKTMLLSNTPGLVFMGKDANPESILMEYRPEVEDISSLSLPTDQDYEIIGDLFYLEDQLIINLKDSLNEINSWVLTGEGFVRLTELEGDQSGLYLQTAKLAEGGLIYYLSYGRFQAAVDVTLVNTDLVLDTIIWGWSEDFYWDENSSHWAFAAEYGDFTDTIFIYDAAGNEVDRVGMWTISWYQPADRLLSLDDSSGFYLIEDLATYDVQTYRGFVYFENGEPLWQRENVSANYEFWPSDEAHQFGDHLLIETSSGDYGNEYYVIASSSAESGLLMDINPGPASGLLGHSIRHEDVIYFSANDGINGAELWRTDGTAIGTYLVSDINAGPGFSEPENFYIWNNYLLFSALGPDGIELYRMTLDGNEEVALLADVNPGPRSSMPFSFIGTDEELYFIARPDNAATFQLFGLPIQLLAAKENYTPSPPLIYPNPASNILHISAPTGEYLETIWLYDQMGRPLINLSLGGLASTSLDISKLPVATYWLHSYYQSGKQSTQAIQRID